jgi:hypothetical protein
VRHNVEKQSTKYAGYALGCKESATPTANGLQLQTVCEVRKSDVECAAGIVEMVRRGRCFNLESSEVALLSRNITELPGAYGTREVVPSRGILIDRPGVPRSLLCIINCGGYLRFMFEEMDRGVYATDMLNIVYVAII